MHGIATDPENFLGGSNQGGSNKVLHIPLKIKGGGGVRACWRTDKHIFQLLSFTHLDCSYGLYSGYTAGIVLLSIQVLAFTIVSIIAHTYPQDFLRKTVFYTVHVYCFGIFTCCC